MHPLPLEAHLAQLILEQLLRQRQDALLAAIDRTPELVGAGLIVIADGVPHLLRPSVHISMFETYVILEMSYAVRRAQDFMWNKMREGAKSAMDRMVKIPGKESSWDAQREFLDAVVAQPITAFVNRPDLYTQIAPKLVGLGLAQLGLVLAFAAVSTVATGGTLVLFVAGAGVFVASASYGLAGVALYYQIVDPEFMKSLEDSAEWSAYQKVLEYGGYVTGIALAARAAGAGVVKRRLVDILKRIEAKQLKNKHMTVQQVADKVNALSEKQFEQLFNRLKAHHISRKTAVLSGARSMRASPATPSAVATRTGTSRFAAAAAVQIRKEWATKLRKDLFRALCVGGVEGVRVGKGTVKHFMTDGGNLIGMSGSALPQSISGPSSGMLNEAFTSMLHTMHCYVVQHPPESKKALP